MRKSLVLATAIAMTFPAVTSAELVYHIAPPGTTTGSGTNQAGGNSDGAGVWFNLLTGTTQVRGAVLPTPLFADGQYFLFSDGRFSGNPANIFTQGFFSRGNGVIYTSSTNLNPARFADGDVITPDTGFQSPGAGFSDLGPNFGNWPTPGRGFLGLTIRDPAGTSAFDIFYGFADITVEVDYGITLNAFGYENVRRQPVTTVAAPTLGDFDFDGEVLDSDISLFVKALTGDFAGLVALFPTRTQADFTFIGDFNADGEVLDSDIEGFVAALLGGAGRVTAIPEPAAVAFLAPSTLLLARRRKP